MTPEATLLIVNAVFLAFAYLWVYPNLQDKTLSAVLWRDVVISLSALLVAGLLYFGTATPFSLLLVSTNWAVFSIITMAIMETPLFFWFAKRHNIDL